MGMMSVYMMHKQLTSFVMGDHDKELGDTREEIEQFPRGKN
jgi:hypothetical protein